MVYFCYPLHWVFFWNYDSFSISGMLFFSHMVEDKTQSGLSYVEFLVHIHRQIQNKMPWDCMLLQFCLLLIAWSIEGTCRQHHNVPCGKALIYYTVSGSASLLLFLRFNSSSVLLPPLWWENSRQMLLLYVDAHIFWTAMLCLGMKTSSFETYACKTEGKEKW